MPRVIHHLLRTALRAYPFHRGQGRVVDRTFLSRLRFPVATLCTRTVHGFSMRVNPNDLIGRHIYLTGQFDRTIADILQAFGKQAGDDGRLNILDIGANIGFVSCCLLHRFPAARVAAVEPLPDIFQMLVENLKSLGGDRARPIQAAVSDQSGTARMCRRQENSGASHLAFETMSKCCGSGGGETRLISGEELMALAGFEAADLIKIDVEGHEAQVLATLSSVIRRCRPRAILFEHDGDLADEASRIGRLLKELAYTPFGVRKRLLHWRLFPVGAAGHPRRAHDYVAVPSELAAQVPHGPG